MKLSESIPLLRENADANIGRGADLSGIYVLTFLLLVVALAVVWWRNRGRPRHIPGKGGAVPGGWAGWPFGRQRSTVDVLGSVHLNSKYSLHEVEWQGKRLLIGCSSTSMQLLAEVPLANCSPDQDHST